MPCIRSHKKRGRGHFVPPLLNMEIWNLVSPTWTSPCTAYLHLIVTLDPPLVNMLGAVRTSGWPPRVGGLENPDMGRGYREFDMYSIFQLIFSLCPFLCRSYLLTILSCPSLNVCCCLFQGGHTFMAAKTSQNQLKWHYFPAFSLPNIPCLPMIFQPFQP